MSSKLATTKTKRPYVFISRNIPVEVWLIYTWKRPEIKLLNEIHMLDSHGQELGIITVDIPRVRSMNVGKEIYFCANARFLGEELISFLESNHIAKRTGQYGVSGLFTYPIMQLLNTNPNGSYEEEALFFAER